jgi:succinyl-CoA synthetase beta subunit
MARKKLSEVRAKTILYGALGQEYSGVTLDSRADWRQAVSSLGDGRFVIKVDQAEKGRFKKGLVKLDRSKDEVAQDAEELFAKGYQFLLVEPFKEHQFEQEWYFASERTRDGNKISFSKSGGVDVESQAGAMAEVIYGVDPAEDIDLPHDQVSKLMEAFDKDYFGFLEINPLVVRDGQFELLDAAVEADGEGEFFEDEWTEIDLRKPLSREPSEEEKVVQELAAKSQASFSLEVINPDGSIFLLLSGGGASVVVADEVFNLGFGKELANYGEYSGNPNFEETRLYTEQIVKLLLKSNAKHKVLLIAGGVANFTDVRVTFKGVVAAIQAHEDALREQGVKVYVRRGGPHEKEGLAAMKDYLEKAGLLGHVAGPDMMLSDIVGLATKEGGLNA